MTASAEGLVTVYIPTRNRLDLLRRAVDSVLSQTYDRIELIVVDDASTDGTRAYLDRVKSEDPRVRCFFMDKQVGACACRNVAIHAASGQFITGLDDDDYFLSNRIELFLASWPSEEDAVGLYSDAFIKGAGGSIAKAPPRRSRGSQADLLKRNFVGNHVFAETSSLKAVGGFDESFPAWQDIELWYRLLAGTRTLVKVPVRTYVVDVGHGLDRVSKSVERITRAFDKFVAKHELHRRERETLRVQALMYRPRELTLWTAVVVLLKTGSIASAAAVASSVLRGEG